MPRRPAPSPLRLHDGPVPSRVEPKHTLPSFPRLCFYPAAPVVQGPAPRARAAPCELEDILPRKQTQGQARLLSVPPSEGTWSGSESSRSPDSAGSGKSAVWSAAEREERVLRGPWDHSSSIRVPLDLDAMLAPPRPAAINPVPVW